MKKLYLLHIKRPNSAPRPSEDILQWENVNEDGIPVFLFQDPTVDSYIQVRTDREPGLALHELITMEATNPLARNPATDKSYLWAYPYMDRLTKATAPRSKEVQIYDEAMLEPIGTETIYSTITLRVLSETGGETTYTGASGLDAAWAAIANLADTDGYVIIDNIQGERTQVIDSRPFIIETEENKPVAKLSNQFGA